MKNIDEQNQNSSKWINCFKLKILWMEEFKSEIYRIRKLKTTNYYLQQQQQFIYLFKEMHTAGNAVS